YKPLKSKSAVSLALSGLILGGISNKNSTSTSSFPFISDSNINKSQILSDKYFQDEYELDGKKKERSGDSKHGKENGQDHEQKENPTNDNKYEKNNEINDSTMITKPSSSSPSS